MSDDRLYLVCILDCIVRIRRYTVDGRDAFLGVHEGEPRMVDWRLIGRFRNVVVHDYLSINMQRIWAIVEHQLGSLEKAVSEALDGLGPADQDNH